MSLRRDDTGKELIASDVRVPLEDAAFLQAVLAAVPAFITRLDPEGRINYINHLRAGVTLADVIGTPALDFIQPEHHDRFHAAVQQALATGKSASYTVTGTKVTGGTTSHFEATAVPIDHGDGRRGVCVIALDVSQRVASEEALKESEAKLRIAVEATGIGLWSWDAASDKFEWSERMTEITGHAPMTGSDYVERVVHPGDRERMRLEFKNARTGDARFPLHRVVRPDGDVRWMMPCGRELRSEDGAVVRLSGGMLDVTGQRLIDERLRQSQKMDAVGSLTAGVAHNFNNMLAVIVPALELAARDAGSAENQVYLDAAQAARRATELIGQLMMFAGQRRAGSPKAHDIGALVERTVSMCKRTFERQLEIDAAIDRGAGLVACDPAAIEQVIVNLLINARDALTAADRIDPKISIELSEVTATRPDAGRGGSGRYVRIRIEDNGAGMSDGVKQRLFEPFFTTKEPGKGTGLGLATSYGIVRDHGGFIAVDSQVGRGTTAEVFLPVASDIAIGGDASLPALAAAPRRSTILIIDDEPAVRRVCDLLLGERGHDVALAADGQAAVAQLDAGLQPDLILLDRSMPGWPVKLTLAEIRKRRADVPVVFFTGQDVTLEERAAVQDVLYKPLSMEDLVRSVEKWLV
jgi:two-component system, cell cycle sensor histidine kinase and response regulator CckA